MDYILSTRRAENGLLGFKQGSVKYLAIPPEDHVPALVHQIKSVDSWFRRATAEAMTSHDPDRGHVIMLVHGYNVNAKEMLAHHRRVSANLRKQGFKGLCVSFDWPSDGTVVGYLNDRKDARWAASFLMESGLTEFAKRQEPDCKIDLSIVAHSMGCYVVREAFDFADGQHAISQKNWTVSQVAFVAADISASSMEKGDSESRSLLRHLARLTNYYSPYDEVLSISSTKRIGASRRLGRVGLPAARSEKTVNLYCGQYFSQHVQSGAMGSHSWYFDDDRFYQDLMLTLNGELDRAAIPGRRRASDGGLALMKDPNESVFIT